MTNFPASLEFVSDTTYTFYDSLKIAELQSQFKAVFRVPLNWSDLFIDTIAVGTKCGHYPGDYTKEQKQVNAWVKERDASSLQQWLQSPNSEKQVYAIRGFYNLQLLGKEISAETKSLINIIKQKKGTISTCIPCDTYPTKISNFLIPYKF